LQEKQAELEKAAAEKAASNQGGNSKIKKKKSRMF